MKLRKEHEALALTRWAGFPLMISARKEYDVLGSFKREIRNGFLFGTGSIAIGVFLLLVGFGVISD